MGRTSKWFRSLLGSKKESKQHHPHPPPAAPIPPSKDITVEESKKVPKEKRRWSFRRSVKDHTSDTIPTSIEPRHSSHSSLECHISESEKEQSKHAIAVAAATAAAADAAVAAAQAAAAVVRLTSSGCTLSHGGLTIEEWAATRIQSAFRGYLARRALRALKGLVKLQALVRGHMVRKQAAATLHCMQALIRVQARVRARRVRMSEEGQAVQKRLLQRRQQESHSRKSNEGWNASTSSIEKQEAEAQSRQAAVMKRERALAYAISQQLDHWMAACSWESSCLDDLSGQEIERRLEESAKIVEMDTGRLKPSSNKRNGSISESSSLEKSISTNQFSATYPLYTSSVQSLQPPTRSPPRIEGQLATPILVSPSQSECVIASALQDLSPRTFSGQYGNVEDCTFSTAESSPQYFSAVSKAQAVRGPFTPSRPEYLENFLQDYSSFPNYMANTESSKAKVRSQSAPRQRPDYYSEKQLLSAKKRSSLPGPIENRSNSCGVRMQRSSSHVGTTCKGYPYASSIQLDKSTMSLRDSECDTASMYSGNYRRSLEPYSSRRC